MKTLDIADLAVRNAFRSKLRTTLTVLSLFVGAFTLTLTTALGAGVNEYVTRQVATISAENVLLVSPAVTVTEGDGPAEYDPNGRESSGSASPLTRGSSLNQADIDAIAAIPEVSSVQTISRMSVDWIAADGGTQFEITVNPTSSIGQSDLIAGDQLDQSSSEHQLVLPEKYVDALGFSSADAAVGQTVTLGYSTVTGADETISATIVGVARESLFASGAGANAAFVDVISQAQAVPGAAASWPLAVATLTEPTDGQSLSAEIDSVKAQLADNDLSGQTVADQLGVVQTVINGIIAVLSAFAVIALVAASFGIINTLMMSVQERTREIGLMKAMGLSNPRVFALFSLEAVVIGFLGSALGALVAIALGTGISAVASQALLSQLPGLTILLFEPANVVGVILGIMVIAFVSGVLPAARAARKNPIDALRYE